jgi:mannose-1-phosphate guanylyltransferase
MKALVLAGGFGTRLRPLSCTRPKILFPIAEDLLMDWILKNLAKSEVDTVVLAVNYMAEQLVRYLGPTKYNLGILYSREQRPMGTGGAVKKAEAFLANDSFLMLNGDIITDLDFRRLVEFHREKGGLATICLVQVDEPSRYGAVELDSESRILRFVEKPEPGMAPSNLINAGIYILEPEIIEHIPEGKKVSMEREVFPVLAENKQLYGFEGLSFWKDVGLPEDYLDANRILLEKNNELNAGDNVTVHESVIIKKPCYFGDNVEIGEDSVIGPFTSLNDNVQIGKGCRITSSVIFPGAVIGDHSSIRNAIIGENTIIERWVKIESGSLVGDYAVIDESVTITEGVSICPSKNVRESILQPGQVM